MASNLATYDSVPQGGSMAKTILNIILALLVLFVILVSAYFIYLNIPGTPEALRPLFHDSNQLQIQNLSGIVSQNRSNMKFNHNNISYTLDASCNEEKTSRMEEAFDEIHNLTKTIGFIRVNDNPDIDISCSRDVLQTAEGDYFIAGEGGARKIIPTGKYNVITSGVILLYDSSYERKCDWPNVEIHELMHVFGFEHSGDKQSLMYPILESCDQRLDSSIVNSLVLLYLEKNLPDLYFENVSAVKSGRYLDFNISVKNSGDIDSPNVSLSVIDEGGRVYSPDLGEMKIGAGVYFQITNLKLSSRSSKNISLVLDQNNTIEELDKENNVARLLM